jgi:hypothetical protein
MDLNVINKINKQVFNQYPYLKDASPKIQKMPDGSTILKYIGSTITANGHTIPISVKVKATEEGNILQISSSR